MKIKYRGSIGELKAVISATGIPGQWRALSDKHRFQSEDDGIINWWPSTGTIQLQGKDPGRADLERALTMIFKSRGPSPGKTNYVEANSFSQQAALTDGRCQEPVCKNCRSTCHLGKNDVPTQQLKTQNAGGQSDCIQQIIYFNQHGD